MLKSSLKFISRSVPTFSLIGLSAGLSALLAANPADAFVIKFDATSDSSNSPATGASASVNFDFVQSGSNVLLNLTLTNTTGQIPSFGSRATQSTLVGFGFDLIDGVTVQAYNSGTTAYNRLYGDVSSFTSNIQPTLKGNATLNPFGTLDVGIRSNGNGNGTFGGGNPTTGLTAGQSGTVTFTLAGSNLVASTLQTQFLQGFQSGNLNAVTRFQQVNAGGGSDKLKLVMPKPPKPASVPEPGTLSALALTGLLAFRHGRNRQAQTKLS